MDAKLTLSIKPDVIARAKEWAKQEGKSLSTAVEEYLEKVTQQTKPKKSSLDIIKELGKQMKTGRPLSDEEYEQRKHDYRMKKYGAQ